MIITGVVKKNTGRGKGLGYPTANIVVSNKVKDGVYIGYANILDPAKEIKKNLPSLIFIGAAITFGATERFAEAYILDFKGRLYGKKIGLELLKKIRGNEKFGSAGEMVAQMIKDERVARAHFGI